MLRKILFLAFVMITQPAQSVTCVTCKCGGVDCSADICPKKML
jgi:hypothetical protein